MPGIEETLTYIARTEETCLEVVSEIHRATDLALCATKQTARSIGRAMAALVAMERRLWLSLTNIKDEDMYSLLEASLSPQGLFGFRLKGNRETERITAYTGDSVLLPCSCIPELHRKPEIFTWEKITDGNNWTQIPPESDEYKERFQLVNDHSSGNLSLLISHLTEQDEGVYRCNVKGDEYRYISLTVKGCRLKGNGKTEWITAYTGDSVLLPCSCTELHRKPETFTWEKSTKNWAQISPESDEYKERFQQVNDHSTGNLSLLISHLTEQDGGLYRCGVKGDEYRDVRLTVKGCRLKGNGETERITAYTGGSVLLPCSCTELHRKPEKFTWEKSTNNWTQISPESDKYKERFQLVNDHSSGNLSLLISHLTVQDGGDYMCNVNGDEYRDVKLTVKGCRLNEQTVDVTGIVGQSVLLPCSCSELQAKPHTFRWSFVKGSDHIKIFPKEQTNLYTDRVQVFNDHPPGNLSLLISHLTVEDGGFYRCEINNKISTDIKLTVKGAPTRPSSSTPVITTTSPHSRPGINSQNNNHLSDPLNTTIIICTAVGVLLLLLILGLVIFWKHRVQRRGQIEINDGQAGQKKEQNDSDALYTTMDPKTKHNKEEEQDGLLYSTVVHSNTVRAAHTPVASEEVTVYASIKTN
ncbi:polymeric immunoglobulin receptor-like [Tachysurus fulvidraco]|uniref:polymeric immunoglobulin receptor-like n=1 Tax=Tachysurus fulvidraco TaxID=1234273 RepID=UPI001FEFE31B|nr:polymeric immunoglobulin receptor-like [Tachysurus fulvidraco]